MVGSLAVDNGGVTCKLLNEESPAHGVNSISGESVPWYGRLL
jgi:hypothetical protein